MTKYLLIAEKPSLMRAIQDCYANHKAEVQQKVGDIEFIALSGHVCRNAQPPEYPEWAKTPWAKISYPMIPSVWKSLPINDDRKKSTLSQLREKVKNCDALICATDSDVEGYGIHYMLSDYLHLQNKPTLRFVEHSLTDKEILKSLLSMTDLHTDPVHIHFTESYLVRSRADWLYGFNLSRVMSLSAGIKMAVGRVKAPTIKMVYDRCNEIDHFVKRVYYEAHAVYDGFKGKLVDEKGKVIQYDEKEEIPSDIPLSGVVKSVKKEKKTVKCKRLYDLSALQTEAGRMFGYSPQVTLDTAQALYETHRVLSYPRTQCRYVSKERAKDFQDLIPALLVFPEIKAVENQLNVNLAMNKNVVNDAEVQKEAHDALLPTGVKADLSRFSATEKNIYFLVCKRLAEQFLPDGIDYKTTALIQHGAYLFKAEGSVVSEKGFRTLSKDKSSVELPAMAQGNAIEAKEINPAECSTKPRPRFTQASLAEAMENIASLIKDDKAARNSLAESKGIGQASTRAKIISEIIKFGYVQEKKDGLYITESGRNYVEALSGIGICDPIFAANLDVQIKKVQRGEESYKEAYGSVLDSLNVAVKKGFDMGKLTCPICGRTLPLNEYRYRCECGFDIPRVLCGHVFNQSEVNLLAKGETIGPLDFKKKDGKEFRAKVKLDDNRKLIFASDVKDTDIVCPKCGKKLKEGEFSYYCSCGVKIPKLFCGHTFSQGEVRSLFGGNEIGPFDLESKSGKKFRASVKLKENGDLELVFPERNDADSELICPECGQVMKDGLYSYYCSCGVKFSKEVCGHAFTPEEIKSMIGEETIGPFSLKSKAGKTFQAAIRMKSDYSYEFVFPNSGGDAAEETSIRCPECGKLLKKNKYTMQCSCGYKIRRTICDRELSDDDITFLLQGDTVGPYRFTSSKGKTFEASVYLEDGELKFSFS